MSDAKIYQVAAFFPPLELGYFSDHGYPYLFAYDNLSEVLLVAHLCAGAFDKGPGFFALVDPRRPVLKVYRDGPLVVKEVKPLWVSDIPSNIPVI